MASVIEKGCPAEGREPVPMPGPEKARAVVQALSANRLLLQLFKIHLQINLLYRELFPPGNTVREITIYG